MPLAIVESCSMYHDGNVFNNFNGWWEQHEEKYSEFDIEKSEFENFIFQKGFGKGDILFIIKANPDKLKVGDVIIFEGGRQNPLIHRIVKIREENGKKIFSTMGDNNNAQLDVERAITEEQLIGKAVFRIAPYLGWSKLIFYDWRKPEAEKGLCNEN